MKGELWEECAEIHEFNLIQAQRLCTSQPVQSIIDAVMIIDGRSINHSLQRVVRDN